MSEIKHTPGPWIVVESAKGPKNAAAWVCTIGNNHNDPAVFSTVLDGDKFVFGDKLADARLIAAAPDLLEALKSLSASIFVPNDERSPELTTALEMTISAIAKAEGRSS